jgi:hypothetical protein
VQAAYSYGISGYDQWGCDVSVAARVPVHEYDCFDTRAPACPGGHPIFHDECVGPKSEEKDGRRFDSLERQVAANGDVGRRLVVKMDVEGAEWDTILGAPESLLKQIDQLEIEFHTNDQPRFVTAVQKLKRYFHVVHVHFNNHACVTDQSPFPAWAYEVLFVNKELDEVSPASVPDDDALDAPNIVYLPDCQSVPH